MEGAGNCRQYFTDPVPIKFVITRYERRERVMSRTGFILITLAVAWLNGIEGGLFVDTFS